MTEVATAAKPPFELSFDGGFIGDSCSADSPCSDAFSCLGRFDSGTGAFPDGYCSAPCPKHTCFDHDEYSWSRCVTFTGFDTPVCMIECRSNADCRDGYSCTGLPKSNRNGERYVCVPTSDAAAAALRVFNSVDSDQSADTQPDDSQHVPTRQNLAAADELIRFNETTDAESGATETQQNATLESLSSWIVPASAGLVVILIVLIAVFRRRRLRATDAGNSLASNVSPRGVGNPNLTLNSPSRSSSHDRPKAASRPLVASNSPVRAEYHEPKARPAMRDSSLQANVTRNHSDAGSRKSSSPPMTESVTAAASEQRSEHDLQNHGVNRPPAGGAPGSTGERTLRTQHLVPSLRPATSAVEADRERAPNEHGEEKPQRVAWKPKRISDPSLSGFAPASFSVRESLGSATTLSIPVAFELCLYLIDRLLQEANAFRVQRGYEDILFIESKPDRVVIQLVDDHQIRVSIPERSLVKTTLATDRVRNHDFTRDTQPLDAHFLSIMKLAAYWTGIDADAANFRSIPLLATYAESSDGQLEQLIQVLSESGPVQSDPHLTNSISDDRLVELYRVTRSGAQTVRAATERLRVARREEDAFTETVCPNCAASVSDGSLACDSCGVPLHPSPFYCPECGRANLLIADGRPQQCVNSSCDTELTRYVPAGELERRRMGIVFSLLSRFDDFQRLAPIGHEERFMAVRDGFAVHIMQASDTAAVFDLESERAAKHIPDAIALPSRVVDEGGLRFVVYEDVSDEALPIRSLSAFRLAESLFVLVAQLAEVGLSLCQSTLDDLGITTEGVCCIRYGHRLPRHGQTLHHSQHSSYAAPEIRMGSAAARSADIYCAAAIWYATVRGVTYDGERLSASVPDDLMIAPHVWDILRRCLDSDPNSRPDSAAKVLSSLRNEKTLSDLI